jgi:hypothetical protein
MMMMKKKKKNEKDNKDDGGGGGTLLYYRVDVNIPYNTFELTDGFLQLFPLGLSSSSCNTKP